MVKQKIQDFKDLHKKKIDMIKNNNKTISHTNLNEHQEDLKRIEFLLNDQINIIKELETDFNFEDKYADEFENEFENSISTIRQKIESEVDILKKVTNPFFDGQTRLKHYGEFTKNYELELAQKKNIFDRLKEQLSVIGQNVKNIQIKNKTVNSNSKNDEEVTIEQKTEIIENKDGEETKKISEETLISTLKDAGKIEEEYDVKHAVEDNAVKLKLEIKITRNPDNTAWAFVYQKYYNVGDEHSISYKSGQIKGASGKLTKLRREYLEKLFHDFDDEIMSKETVKQIKDAIKECIDKDNINVY